MEENKYMDFMPKMVDLGLSSGTLWADRNVGAEKPEDYGEYFRFGETEPYTERSPRYQWRIYHESIEGTDLDVSTVHFNRKCHTPTFEQIKELHDNCSHEWTSLNGVNGIRVIGPNGKSIFFPAAGYRDCLFGAMKDVGLCGCYRSATTSANYSGYRLIFNKREWAYDSILCVNGYTVRPVAQRGTFG